MAMPSTTRVRLLVSLSMRSVTEYTTAVSTRLAPA